MKNYLLIIVFVLMPVSLVISQEGEIENTGMIIKSIDVIVERIMSTHPELEEALLEIKVREGYRKQAGLMSNPSIVNEVEEFAGSGERSQANAISGSVGLSIEIPTGGKLTKRKAEADYSVDLARLEYQIKALELKGEIRSLYLSLFVLQERESILRENMEQLDRLHTVVSKRVLAGELSPLEELKSGVESASASVRFQENQLEMKNKKREMASLWKGSIADLDGLVFETGIVELPVEKQLISLAHNSPYGILISRLPGLADVVLEREKAEGWPDLGIEGGVQHFSKGTDYSFYLNVSIPLPFLNWNQGNIEAAKASALKSRKEMEGKKLRLDARLQESITRYNSAREALLLVSDKLLPVAQATYVSVQKAWACGEEDFIVLMEAGDRLLQIRNELLNKQSEAEIQLIEIEKLCGMKIETLTN